MKKILIASLLLMFGFTTYCEARITYDSTGRNIVKDNTIRGRKRTAEAEKIKKQHLQAAAAAKLNYEEALKYLEKQDSKTNYNHKR